MVTTTQQETASLPKTVERMDAERLRAYQENLAFYDGSGQWQGRPRGRERRLTFNYARVTLDKVTSYLMADLRSTVPPANASPEERDRSRFAEELLAEVAEVNNLDQLDFDTELDTAVLGDGAYKVTWDAEEQRVRITAPDVQGLFAWWVGDDVNRVWRVASRYRLAWEEAEALHGVTAPRQATRPQEAVITEVWTPRTFQLWVDEALVRDDENPYGFIPFVIYPNIRAPKQFWGVSDIPALVEPARELNRALSQLSTILELSGNPIAILENVDQAQDIAVRPGAVWELPEKARAYLLDLLQGGGVQLHIDYVNAVYRALHDLSEAPRTAFGENRQGLSGVALEMELHPLLQKVRRKRLIRSAAYRRRNEMTLRILEQRTGRDLRPYRTRIEWGPVLPQDGARLAREETELVRSGIHARRTAMARLGVLDPEAELQRVREEERPESG